MKILLKSRHSASKAKVSACLMHLLRTSNFADPRKKYISLFLKHIKKFPLEVTQNFFHKMALQ